MLIEARFDFPDDYAWAALISRSRDGVAVTFVNHRPILALLIPPETLRPLLAERRGGRVFARGLVNGEAILTPRPQGWDVGGVRVLGVDLLYFPLQVVARQVKKPVMKKV